MKTKTLGEKIIEGLKEFNEILKSGKPVEQHTVRRMRVKGKTVYVRDKFVGPVGKVNTEKK